MQNEAAIDISSKTDSWSSRFRSWESVVVLCFGVALSLPITIPWIVLIVGCALWFLKVRFSPRLIGNAFVATPLSMPVAAFALTYFISGIANGGIKEILPTVTMLRTFVVYFWAYQKFSENPLLKEKAVSWLLIAGAISGLVGMFEQLSGFHLGFKYLQGTGFLSGPMAFAGQMQLFGLLCIGLLLTRGDKSFTGILQHKPVFLLTVCALVAGLLFAGERSAWLGFAVALVVMAGCLSPRMMLKVLAGVIVGGAVAWFTVPMVQVRFAPLITGQRDPSTRGRMLVWSRAIEEFQSTPKSMIVGIGPRNFPHIKLDEAIVPGIKVKDYLDHAHSNYLQALATTGILGFIAYIWLTCAAILLAWKTYRVRSEDRFDRALGLGILGGLISLTVAGIFEYNFGTGQVRMTQWFLLAFLTLVRAATDVGRAANRNDAMLDKPTAE